MKKKVLRKTETFLHFLTAAIILIKGYDELTKHIFFPAFILLSFGLLVLVTMLLWRPLRIKPKEARRSCYFIEAPALLVISYVVYLEGRHTVPYIFLIAAFLYPAMGFISSKKWKKINKQHF